MSLTYDGGLAVFIALGIIWLLFNFEVMVFIGFCWAIAGISKSNAIKQAQREDEPE